MKPIPTKEAITELRQDEEHCRDVVASIRRKLRAGSDVVTPELLLKWERRLSDVQALLSEAGAPPLRAEDGSPL